MRLVLIAVVGAMVAFGCANPPPPAPFEGPHERVNVRLVPLDPGRTEIVEVDVPRFVGATPEYATGPVWAAVFVGDSASTDATFEIRSTRMTQTGRRGSAWTYEVVGDLTCGGESHRIETSGRQTAFTSYRVAMRETVERAVEKAAREARVLGDKCLWQTVRRLNAQLEESR